jgi:glycosyltransferase involved in cell wall biosynthesis
MIGELGRGGTEQQLQLLMTHLDAAHHDRHVLVFNQCHYPGHEFTLETNGVRLWRVPSACRSIRHRMGYVYKLLRSLQPDVVHSWTTHDNPYAGIVGRLANVPVRLGSVRGALSPVLPGRLSGLTRSLSLRSVSGLMVNCTALASELQAAGISPRRLAVIPNCVELQSETLTDCADLREFGIEKCHRVIGTVGNLRRVKNHLTLVDAMAHVAHDHPDVRCVIVGQPIPRERAVQDELEKRIAHHNLHGRVILAGFRSDVRAIIRRFEIFCLTSNSEGLPNALLEAMSEGKAVIATRVGGIPEVVHHGINGWLIDPSDTAGLRQAITTLLATDGARERLGAAANATVSHLSCASTARRLSSLYHDAFNGKWPSAGII